MAVFLRATEGFIMKGRYWVGKYDFPCALVTAAATVVELCVCFSPVPFENTHDFPAFHLDIRVVLVATRLHVVICL